MKQKLIIVTFVMALVAIACDIFIFATHRTMPDDVYRKAVKAGYKVYAPPIPDDLSFAGEAVPLNIYYTRESLDRELLSFMYGQINMLLFLKRANRYFPVIEPILKRNGIPQDFKYMCVIESGLQNATSSAQAQGFWQFVKGTGESYGLEVSDDVDMRNDVEAATEAACAYLKDLHRQFGSWTEAAAAYNCGETALQRQIDAQGVKNYYDLRLNKETARYVFRILAMKCIMQHPADYGYNVRKCDLYPPIPYRTIQVREKDVNLYELAAREGCVYRMVRELNPWILNETLKNPNGKCYTLRLPIENGTEMTTLTHDTVSAELIEAI